MKSERIPVYHHVFLTNWALFVIPAIALITCYSIYLSGNGGRVIPSMPRVIEQYTELRVYSVLMTLQTVLMGVIFYIRIGVLTISAKFKHVVTTRKFTVLKYLVATSSGLMCIGNFVMSIVPDDDCHVLSVIAIHVFFLSGIVYFICSDVMMAYTARHSSCFSRVLTWSCTVFGIFYIVTVCYLDRDDTDVQTVGGCLGIITILAVNLKLSLIGHELPKHVIRMIAKT